MSKSCNKDGGEHMRKNDKLTKDATSARGRGKQKRGSSSSNASAKYAQPQKRFTKDTEF